jgi:outer membrane protein insertion porin family
MKRTLFSGLLLAFAASTGALAFEPFEVKDIRVEGIQRTEAGTVFSYLPVQVGQTFTKDQAAEAIRALFATGFFNDVRIDVENGVLVVVVDERPAVAHIDFVGIKEFDKEALLKGLRDVGMAEGRIFDRALLERAEQELKRQYLSRGRYAATITTTLTPLERNRVGLNFQVNEGATAKIREIRIIGAKAFSEKTLRNEMTLTTPGWLTWYTRNDQYSRQKLSADLEALRSFYLNQGYLDFNLDATQVSITPDRTGIHITLVITEGAPYTVSGIEIAGNTIVPTETLQALVTVEKDRPFSRERLAETTKAISDRLGNEGYAFANVNAAPELDREARKVHLTLFVDPGRRVYVDRVNITGNDRTRDEVIRREMRQHEKSWFDGELIARSRTRVERLGYFDEVNIETPPVPGSHDQVDVNIDVKERPTGSLMLGAGFSSSEKVTLSASVSQENLFGTGNAMTLAINTGRVNRTYSLSFTDPYFTPDGISLGWDVYHRNTDPSTLSVAPYKTSSSGAGIRMGYPVTEDDAIRVGLAVDRTRITTFENSPAQYKRFVDTFGNTASSLVGSAGWSRDKRDSAIFPRRGLYQRVYTEVALPAADLRYGKVSVQHQHWFPIGRDYALMLNLDLGWGRGYAGKPMPFYKSFYAGGIGSVRGYEDSSLGPKVDRDALGGNRRVVGNVEFFFPMPGSGTDRSMRLSAFLDAGQVWAQEDKLRLSDLRYSTGLAFSWGSPIGPLKFSLGVPLNKGENDRAQKFQFQLGTTF